MYNIETIIAAAPPYYEPYLRKVPDGEIMSLLRGQLAEIRMFYSALPAEKLNFRYAPGKWTPLEILGHLLDSERVFQYRCLRFGRGDNTELPGFDENIYVPAGRFTERSLESLLEEFEAVRKSSVMLLEHMTEADLARTGTANGNHISVLAMAYILVGHPLHHLGVVRERYLESLPVG